MSHALLRKNDLFLIANGDEEMVAFLDDGFLLDFQSDDLSLLQARMTVKQELLENTKKKKALDSKDKSRSRSLMFGFFFVVLIVVVLALYMNGKQTAGSLRSDVSFTKLCVKRSSLTFIGRAGFDSSLSVDGDEMGKACEFMGALGSAGF